MKTVNKYKLEVAKKLMSLIKKYVVTNKFATIEDLVKLSPDALGTEEFYFKYNNLVIWDGVSEEFINAVISLLSAGDMVALVAHPRLYDRKLKYKAVKIMESAKGTKHKVWAPLLLTVDKTLIDYIKERNLEAATNHIPPKALVLKKNYARRVKDMKSLYRMINLYGEYKFLTETMNINPSWIKVFVEIHHDKMTDIVGVAIVHKRQFNMGALRQTVKDYLEDGRDFHYKGFRFEKDKLIVTYEVEG